MEKRTLEGLIDNRPISALQIGVFVICGLLGLLDGYDTQSIAFVAPAIARSWHLDPSSFTPVFVAGGIGSLLGVPFGSVADRFGRRRCLLIVTAIAALGALVTPLATSVPMLIACRVISGFGLGGMIPSLIALTAEYSPKRLRNSIVTAIFSSFPLGAVIAGASSGAFITEHNWRLVFWIGGAAPLLMLPVIAFLLPESLSWLTRNGREAEARSILQRMGREPGAETAAPAAAGAAPPRSSAVGLLHVHRDGRGLVTVLLSSAFFVSLLLSYLLVNWIPTLAVQTGATLRQGALATALLNISGIVGGIIIARVSDRVSPHAVVAICYAMGASAIAALAIFVGVGHAVFAFTLIAGLFCIGAQLTLVSLVSAYYPVEVRSSGVALVGAAGRIGGIVGPIIGGLLIGGVDPGRPLGWTVAGASLIAAVCVWLVRRRVRAQALAAQPAL